jgi:tripartite-type tricarboxylate transporter receptor subunit TctC
LWIGGALFALPLHAQWKPTHDVEFVVPFGAGGGADLTARVVAKVITDQKLVPAHVAIVNKPGGGTSVGIANVVTNRSGDGNTLVLINPQSQITPIKFKDSKGWRDLTPIANLMLDDYLMLTYKESPFKTPGDVVKFAKSKPPRTLSIASSGPADDMAVTVFEAATGIRFKIVRFDGGGQIQTMLLGKHVDLGVGNPLEDLGQINAGNLRALGVYRPTRFDLMKNVPTMKEQGINVVPFQMWRGIALPPGAPADAQRYWQGVIAKVVASKEFKDYLRQNMATEHALYGKDFTTFLEQQETLYRDMLARLEQK